MEGILTKEKQEINQKLIDIISQFTSEIEIKEIVEIDLKSLIQVIEKKSLDKEHTLNNINKNCFQKAIMDLNNYFMKPLNGNLIIFKCRIL
jgi:hypothetical protein